MFRHKIEIDGEQIEFELKPVEEVPMGIAILEDFDSEELQAKAMLKWALSDEQYELFKLAPLSAGMKLVEAWQKGMTGTGLGESAASPPSSKTTARPSKPTASDSDFD